MVEETAVGHGAGVPIGHDGKACIAGERLEPVRYARSVDFGEWRGRRIVGRADRRPAWGDKEKHRGNKPCRTHRIPFKSAVCCHQLGHAVLPKLDKRDAAAFKY
jgi:hypothetical protein